MPVTCEAQSASMSFRLGKEAGDPYAIICPQVKGITNKKDAFLQRADYAQGLLRFHEESGLSKTFSDFGPEDLTSFSASFGYQLGYSMLNFNTDGLFKASQKNILKAERGWKYGIAVVVAKGFGYPLSEREIPYSDTNAFTYFKQGLFNGRANQIEVLGSLLAMVPPNDGKVARETLEAYKLSLMIKLMAGGKVD